MAKNQLNGKRGKIDQANSFMVIIIAVSSFLVVFSLTSAKALISQYAYQERVISAQQRTITQIKTDLNAVSSLVTSYEAFANTSTNIIGGNPSGTGPRDGNNAKIVLDALPTESVSYTHLDVYKRQVLEIVKLALLAEVMLMI